MKFSTKIILGVIAFAALCVVYYSDDYFSRKKEEKKNEESKALYFETSEALQLSLKNSSGKFVLTRDNKNAQWKMSEPKQVDADEETVSAVLNALSKINVQQALPGTENTASKKDVAALNQFGLGSPQLIATVTLANKKTQTLEIGAPVEIGQKNQSQAAPVSFYGLNTSRPLIFVFDASNINLLLKKNFENFRTKRLGNFQTNDVAAISIHSKSVNMTAEKKQGKWMVLTPHSAIGDESFISSFLQMYHNLSAKKVFEKETVVQTGLAKYDLENPAAWVKFVDEKNKTLQEFTLGITKEGVFAKMSDGAVGQLDLASWPDYVPLAVKFQNRQILLGINTSQISSLEVNKISHDTKKGDVASFVAQLENLTADDVLYNNTPADLNMFGLSKPTKKFSLIFTKESKLSPIEISIGNFVLHNKKSVYLKRSDLPTVYVVNGDWLAQMDKLNTVTKN